MRQTQRIIAYTALVVALFCTVLHVSCKKKDTDNTTVTDPCASVTCHNGGACSNGVCSCPTGTYGSLCDSVYRNAYSDTYSGNGMDDDGNILANFRITLSTTPAELNRMSLQVQNAVGTSTFPALTVELSSTSTAGAALNVVPSVSGAYSYSGGGTVSSDTLTLHVTQKNGADSVVFTFDHFARQ